MALQRQHWLGWGRLLPLGAVHLRLGPGLGFVLVMGFAVSDRPAVLFLSAAGSAGLCRGLKAVGTSLLNVDGVWA